jgi:hypothetical protein
MTHRHEERSELDEVTEVTEVTGDPETDTEPDVGVPPVDPDTEGTDDTGEVGDDAAPEA